MKQETTTIKATKDLYNCGKCFTKGETYVVKGMVFQKHALMNRVITNDMGEKHVIGLWYKHFQIV